MKIPKKKFRLYNRTNAFLKFSRASDKSVGWEKTQFEMESSTIKTKDEEENTPLQSSARGRQPTSAPNNHLTRYKKTKPKIWNQSCTYM